MSLGDGKNRREAKDKLKKLYLEEFAKQHRLRKKRA
jgi:hypothetical protein